MSRELTPFERYLDDLEEVLITEGLLSLAVFAPWQGDDGVLMPDRTPAAIEAMCRRAYDYLTTTYALHLEWFDWPPRTGRPAEPDVALDFEPYDEIARPRLALVADDLDATAAKVEAKWAALAAEVRGSGRAAEDPA